MLAKLALLMLRVVVPAELLDLDAQRADVLGAIDELAAAPLSLSPAAWSAKSRARAPRSPGTGIAAQPFHSP